MSTISVVIETTDRRRSGHPNYLGETLKNFQRAGGFDAPELGDFGICVGEADSDFVRTEVDPHVPERLLSQQELYYFYHKSTRQQTAQRAIQMALRGPERDYVLKLEDDLDFCDDFLSGAVRWLDKYKGQAPMYSLAATFQQVRHSNFANNEQTIFDVGESFPIVRKALLAGADMLLHPSLGFWGAQAIALPWACARLLSEYLGPDPFFFDGKEQYRHRGHDLKLQQWMYSLRCSSVPCAVPAMVQHEGRRSNLDQPSIGHVQPFFQFPFAGREWRYA